MGRGLFAVLALGAWLGTGLAAVLPSAVGAFEPAVLDSVVSVLPLWPGRRLGGTPGTPPGSAPEGSAVAVLPGGYLATALHVVDRAEEISVRLKDGRILPARLIGRDPPSDLALLKIAADLPVLEAAPEPPLGAPVCAVGNPFGLGLSVTCGVVSAVRRAGVGFNPVEDFIQTDAAVNPGASGGALVDREGRLVGLLAAIFTKESDADIGVNFAVSAALLGRVVEDLAAGGRVRRPRPGFRVAALDPAAGVARAGVKVLAVFPGSGAAAAGLAPGDLVSAVDGRAVASPAAVVAAYALRRPGEAALLTVWRDGKRRALRVPLAP